MAVAYETSLAPTSVSFLAAGEAETIAFDAGSGANRILLVYVAWFDKGNLITGITYNGVALARVTGGSQVSIDFGGFILSCDCWYLAGATVASGTNNIVVTMDPGDSNSAAQISAWVGNGVDSGTPIDGYQSAAAETNTANATQTVTVTTGATGDRVVAFFASKNDSTSLTGSASNYTERQDAADGGGLSTECGDADGAASVAAQVTWSNGAIDVWKVAIGINLNASTAGPVVDHHEPHERPFNMSSLRR